MINCLTASGYVGNDIEVRYTQNQKAVGTFSLAVKQGYGEYEKTSWVTCTLFGKRAEALKDKITKGSIVAVTGEFVMDEWEKDGQKHSRPALICNQVHIARYGTSNTGDAPQASAQHRPAQQQPQGFDNFPDDDIPW